MNNKQSQIIIITGMHRSGTSLVTSILQSSGLHIGDKFIYDHPQPGNPKGNFEDIDFEEFQDKVLVKRGLSMYLTDKKPIFLDTEEIHFAKKLIQLKSTRSIWGWKDPRTSLFLDFWNEHIPHAKFFFIYRHPIEVLFSLLKRGDKPVIDNPLIALDMWKIYNGYIVDFIKKEPDKCSLCHVHGILQDRDKVSKFFSEKLGLQIVPFIDKLYDPKLLQLLPIPDCVNIYLKQNFNEIFELYDKLQKLADIPFYDSYPKLNGCGNNEIIFLQSAIETSMLAHKWLLSSNQQLQIEITRIQNTRAMRIICWLSRYQKLKVLLQFIFDKAMSILRQN